MTEHAATEGPRTPGSHQLVLVTGPSGAGRSTAINALEDLGYEVIDNLPLSLVPRLVEGAPVGPIALGLDIRNRDFNATSLIELIDRLTRNPDTALDVVYVDCSTDELVHRYNQTRRRHPLGEAPEEAIASEIDLLAPVRVRADVLIDTTAMSPHDLKAEIGRWFGRASAAPMSVQIQSFSYKRGAPRGVDMIFDCRFLSNPHWVPGLREKDGRDADVVAHISADPRFEEFFRRVSDLVLFLLPAQLDEGKAHLTIGFGCTGGQHRSVALAEMLGNLLAQRGWPVSKRHRELERRVVERHPTQAG
ncbi:RNase adapter RapZ [Falsirhodobacter algicola]|uniref:RNase adapter RapZ n=1 Tax=Falsirhodobacter algicola TaxID=2692330 RepID=UPI0020129114|nr:RNase adapter RapZ [Falsirhodobacter algicola]